MYSARHLVCEESTILLFRRLRSSSGCCSGNLLRLLQMTQPAFGACSSDGIRAGVVVVGADDFSPENEVCLLPAAQQPVATAVDADCADGVSLSPALAKMPPASRGGGIVEAVFAGDAIAAKNGGEISSNVGGDASASGNSTEGNFVDYNEKVDMQELGAVTTSNPSIPSRFSSPTVIGAVQVSSSVHSVAAAAETSADTSGLTAAELAATEKLAANAAAQSTTVNATSSATRSAGATDFCSAVPSASALTSSHESPSVADAVATAAAASQQKPQCEVAETTNSSRVDSVCAAETEETLMKPKSADKARRTSNRKTKTTCGSGTKVLPITATSSISSSSSNNGDEDSTLQLHQEKQRSLQPVSNASADVTEVSRCKDNDVHSKGKSTGMKWKSQYAGMASPTFSDSAAGADVGKPGAAAEKWTAAADESAPVEESTATRPHGNDVKSIFDKLTRGGQKRVIVLRRGTMNLLSRDSAAALTSSSSHNCVSSGGGQQKARNVSNENDMATSLPDEKSTASESVGTGVTTERNSAADVSAASSAHVAVAKSVGLLTGKSLEEREREYNALRAHIFASSREESSSLSSTTPIPPACTSASTAGDASTAATSALQVSSATSGSCSQVARAGSAATGRPPRKKGISRFETNDHLDPAFSRHPPTNAICCESSDSLLLTNTAAKASCFPFNAGALGSVSSLNSNNSTTSSSSYASQMRYTRCFRQQQQPFCASLPRRENPSLLPDAAVQQQRQLDQVFPSWAEASRGGDGCFCAGGRRPLAKSDTAILPTPPPPPMPPPPPPPSIESRVNISNINNTSVYSPVKNDNFNSKWRKYDSMQQPRRFNSTSARRGRGRCYDVAAAYYKTAAGATASQGGCSFSPLCRNEYRDFQENRYPVADAADTSPQNGAVRETTLYSVSNGSPDTAQQAQHHPEQQLIYGHAASPFCGVSLNTESQQQQLQIFGDRTSMMASNVPWSYDAANSYANNRYSSVNNLMAGESVSTFQYPFYPLCSTTAAAPFGASSYQCFSEFHQPQQRLNQQTPQQLPSQQQMLCEPHTSGRDVVAGISSAEWLLPRKHF